MKPLDKPLHSWTLSPKQAVKLQKELREQLILEWDGRRVSTVAGVDVGIKGGFARAAVVVLDYPDLVPIEGVSEKQEVKFPYIPGLLSFREGPVILAAWEKLETKPDLVLFDGQGIAHPRGIGLAAHIGLWLARPSIGVAKSRLYGHHETPGPNRSENANLHDEHNPSLIIGTVLRTRTNVKPVFISPGHLIGIPKAAEFVLHCCTRYRLPEPTRWAHRVAGGAILPASPREE
jgi:deoxyribonuclease V